jgi:hypothetical protein
MASEVGVALGRRCGGRNAWGMAFTLVRRPSTIKLNDEKIREMGGPLAIYGHHLAIPHNNQIIAGVSGVEGVWEGVRLRRNVQRKAMTLLQLSNGSTKKKKE